MENNLARKRILEQIAQDRAERRARDQPQPAQPVQSPQTSQLPLSSEYHSLMSFIHTHYRALQLSIFLQSIIISFGLEGNPTTLIIEDGDCRVPSSTLAQLVSKFHKKRLYNWTIDLFLNFKS